MADLISLARAKVNLNSGEGTSFTAAQESTISTLITSVSKAVKTYCGREFDSQSFDELYDGCGQQNLVLRQFPIVSVARVAHSPVSVLRVTNTSATNQRATVAVTSTGLSLVRVASGTTTTSTIAFADQATLSALATAITALGNGWSGSVADSRYNNWPSADLRSVQGALNARDVYAELRLHTSELSAYDLDENAGFLTRSRQEPLDLTDPLGTGLTWFGGRGYWRVKYTAGYVTVPEDVQEACGQWVAHLYWRCQRDPGKGNTFTSGSGSSFFAEPAMPAMIRRLLDPYRQRRL